MFVCEARGTPKGAMTLSMMTFTIITMTFNISMKYDAKDNDT
jgi:hypothetical protein